MISPAHARERLELEVLTKMADGSTPEFGVEDTYYNLRYLVSDAIDRELARALLRSLTDRGFCQYHRGLFTDDGYLAGSGYGITRRGRKYRAALEELMSRPIPNMAAGPNPRE